MIVRQFISWVRTAPAGERAEATRSLARAWLISDLGEEDHAERDRCHGEAHTPEPSDGEYGIMHDNVMPAA